MYRAYNLEASDTKLMRWNTDWINPTCTSHAGVSWGGDATAVVLQGSNDIWWFWKLQWYRDERLNLRLYLQSVDTDFNTNIHNYMIPARGKFIEISDLLQYTTPLIYP